MCVLKAHDEKHVLWFIYYASALGVLPFFCIVSLVYPDVYSWNII